MSIPAPHHPPPQKKKQANTCTHTEKILKSKLVSLSKQFSGLLAIFPGPRTIGRWRLHLMCQECIGSNSLQALKEC